MKRRLIAGAAIAGLLALPAAAQQSGSRQTREFVQAAAQPDQFEIMEAHTVLAQSTDPRVRDFAQRMIEAHRQTSATLLQAAASARLQPPEPGLSGDQAAFLAALQSQQGSEFDKAYIRQQVLAHRSTLAVEQAYAASGDNAMIRQVAASTVPTVTAHLQMAEQVSALVGGS